MYIYANKVQGFQKQLPIRWFMILVAGVLESPRDQLFQIISYRISCFNLLVIGSAVSNYIFWPGQGILDTSSFIGLFIEHLFWKTLYV